MNKGEEMGWFEQGSTIIVFAPAGAVPCSPLQQGDRIKMGRALLRMEPPRDGNGRSSG